jgi:hypothetical protein
MLVALVRLALSAALTRILWAAWVPQEGLELRRVLDQALLAVHTAQVRRMMIVWSHRLGKNSCMATCLVRGNAVENFPLAEKRPNAVAGTWLP